MRKFLALIAVITLTMGLFFVGTVAAAPLYKDGVYEANANGKEGPVWVKVTVEQGTIVNVEVTKHNETPFLSDAAISDVPAAIVAAQSADVDGIGGATMTSDAIKAAVKSALAAVTLKGAAAAPVAEKSEMTSESYSADIVVIGAGGAGLSAAVEAAKAGSKVIVLEKMPMVGGNTLRATGGMNAAGTTFQTAKGISDDAETFYNDTMKGGHELNNPSLVRILANKAAEAVNWLVSLGANLSDVGQLGGASQPRAHRPAGGGAVGVEVVKTLHSQAKALGVEILLNTKAVELMTDGTAVVGVKAVKKDAISVTIKAKAVVLATGGFGANQEMVSKISPELAGFGTTNHPGATGDGLELAGQVGSDFVDLEQIQTHPTVVPEKGIMITEAVRGNGAILVSRDGVRFVNELETRDVVSEAILKQTGKTAFLVFDDGVRSSLKAIESYAKGGLLTEAETPAAMAEKLGIPGEMLMATVSTYNKQVASGQDSSFGRQSLPRQLNQGSYYAVEVGPAVHHTMGGIKINENAEVIATNGNVIPGLFAAGEVTGGVHGGNRLGGNAVADIVTFGRIAGRNAVNFGK